MTYDEHLLKTIKEQIKNSAVFMEIRAWQKQLSGIYNQPIFKETKKIEQQFRVIPAFRAIQEQERIFKALKEQIVVNAAFTATNIWKEQTLSATMTTQVQEAIAVYQKTLVGDTLSIGNIQNITTLKQSISNIALGFSQSPAFEIQQRISEIASLLGTISTQVPSFEKLPKTFQEEIQHIVIREEDKQREYQKMPGVKKRSRLINKIKTTRIRKNIIECYAFYNILMEISRRVTDPALLQDLQEKLIVLSVYIEYLYELFTYKY